MNRHATTEQLSAYLDRELGIVELRQLEAHCASCVECNTRLTSMRQVVQGLDRVGRAAPPVALRQQIRRQVMVEAATPANGFRAAFERFRLHLLAMRPTLYTASVMGLATVVGLFALNHQAPQPAPRPAPSTTPRVTFTAGAIFKATTSEVAGREFTWTETRGWIQKGLVGETPEVQVEAGSPAGKALLNKYSELKWLLADGSPVLLRYNLGTVEIRPKSPTRVLGYERDFRPGLVAEA